MDNPQPISVLLLGDENVGKSTFLSRLTLLRTKDNLRNLAHAPPLLRDSDQPFVFELRSRTQAFRLEFSDTASPENWRCLRPDVVVLCYDVSHRPSLASLQSRWTKEVRTVFAAHSDLLPVLVLGLKRDLRRSSSSGGGGGGDDDDDDNGQDTDSVVYPHEAYNLAQQLRADMYLECSAATGELVPEVFDDICRRAVQTASPGGGQSEGGCRVM
ncbi:Rho-like protein [Niveomyces insectorum RCEF 264]|uniref:Rho-like protein n=1 Tax=Niveomyces insectorum RCEF 264 TaxID=1081102 RepID=A0A162KDB3_9HYPO|nr:Rho-like protein [Niveomyces insectorum RCEF 264]